MHFVNIVTVAQYLLINQFQYKYLYYVYNKDLICDWNYFIKAFV